MTKAEVRARIEAIGIIAAVRLYTAEDAVFAAEAIASGGIPIIEVPMTVPNGVTVIEDLARRHPTMIVGAGTVWDQTMAEDCIYAGAAFITTTGLDTKIVEYALAHDVVVFPGALTPSEVMAAHKAGADFVKVFPCAPVGGASYIKALKAPFPEIPLIASGGVNPQTVADYFHAGAVAVGIGESLLPAEAIHRREPSWIRELARRFLLLVEPARKHVTPRH